MDNKLVKTGLTVSDGDADLPVFLTPFGDFLVQTEDDTDVRKPTFAALVDYFTGVVKRKEARVAKQAGKPPVVVTVLRDERYGTLSATVDVTVRGLGVDGSRVLASGLPKGERLDGFTKVYKQFSADDHTELTALEQAVLDANAAKEAFLKERRLGSARDVARKVEDGVTVE